MRAKDLKTVNEIREQYDIGVSQSQLARDYGLSRSTIQNYIRGYYRVPKVIDTTMEDWAELAKENQARLSRRADAVHCR